MTKDRATLKFAIVGFIALGGSLFWQASLPALAQDPTTARTQKSD
jgi:hypothetical protein